MQPAKHLYYRFYKPAGFITTCDDEKGRKTADVPFVNGKMHGDALYYYATGELKEKVPYKNGSISGVKRVYYVNGKVKHLGKWSQTTSRHQREFEKQFLQ